MSISKGYTALPFYNINFLFMPKNEINFSDMNFKAKFRLIFHFLCTLFHIFIFIDFNTPKWECDHFFAKMVFILYEKEISFHCNKTDCTSWWYNCCDYQLLSDFSQECPTFLLFFGSVLIRGERTMDFRNKRPPTQTHTNPEKQRALCFQFPARSHVYRFPCWDSIIWELNPRTLVANHCSFLNTVCSCLALLSS